MIFPQTFDDAYIWNDDQGCLQIILVNSLENSYLWFDGMDFFSLPGGNPIPAAFERWDYISETPNRCITIESIKSDGLFIFYFKTTDGDVGQIYFMLDGSGYQRLMIYNKTETGKESASLDMNIYEAVNNRYAEISDVEVEARDSFEI
ncbi:hypothetical protein [Chitinophaga sp. Cy-1792]|uniref:hypothetical protein n=1 Tax=Chitinophaga sp. Cy-1792 TaxID=2608339 RepID=UPI00141E5D2E|nr:hypothetical protein [Chitinophaga sp. Cy-1792]NIG54876.1 hypothetical protein [Chitinophaga sp. Cy-1792]